MICLHCGEPERCEVFEVWSSGEFQLDTCCEGMREAAHDYLNELDPKAAAAWLSTLGHDGDETPILPALHDRGLRRVASNDGQLLLDWNLEVVPIAWRDARAFILEHHAHNAPPAGWRYGAGVRNGSQLVAVVCVGRPVARGFDATKVVEVNRLCVRRDVPSALVWNACSLLYGWAAREAKRRGFTRIVTYTLDSEPGTTLRAAGWVVDGAVRARRNGWHAASRPRDSSRTPNESKTRWARALA